MLIRIAKEEDARRIREISLDLNISRDSEQVTGFVEYKTPNELELREMIRENRFFYVAEGSNEVIGFLSSYSHDILRRLKHFSEDRIIQYILTKQPPFIYADQLAVIKKHQNRLFGGRLLQHLTEDATNFGYTKLYGVVVNKPHKNDISTKLLTGFGWALIEELESQSGLGFGIYEKKL